MEYDHYADWIKCNDGFWCPLFNVDLDPVSTVGVYIVWRMTPLPSPGSPHVLYVGQGDVKDRLNSHLRDGRFNKYVNPGWIVYATWSEVAEYGYIGEYYRAIRDGVERYLADQLRPEIGMQYPAVAPISVNLPNLF